MFVQLVQMIDVLDLLAEFNAEREKGCSVSCGDF